MIQALTPERGILSLKSAGRPERRNQQPQKEEEQRDHRGRRYVIPSPDQTDEVFSTHSILALLQVCAGGTAYDYVRCPTHCGRHKLGVSFSYFDRCC